MLTLPYTCLMEWRKLTPISQGLVPSDHWSVLGTNKWNNYTTRMRTTQLRYFLHLVPKSVCAKTRFLYFLINSEKCFPFVEINYMYKLMRFHFCLYELLRRCAFSLPISIQNIWIICSELELEIIEVISFCVYEIFFIVSSRAIRIKCQFRKHKSRTQKGFYNLVLETPTFFTFR